MVGLSRPAGVLMSGVLLGVDSVVAELLDSDEVGDWYIQSCKKFNPAARLQRTHPHGLVLMIPPDPAN